MTSFSGTSSATGGRPKACRPEAERRQQRGVGEEVRRGARMVEHGRVRGEPVGVLGLGVPQVTATVDCAAARDAYFKKTSRYVPILTDGGMSKGGDVCKALACGADAVMVGSAFAKAHEAPGCGYHWGMATPHANLPRGTRIKVGTTGSLKQILFGPAEVDDGSQNLVGAITTCMGNVGARDLAEFQQTEIIIAPSIKTEGKLFQAVQSVGMGTR